MSEQDFFFDEEPDAKAPKAPKAPVTPPKSSVTAPEAVAASTDQSTTWAVAALIGVIGLLLGAILGFVLGDALAGTTSTDTAATAPAPITGTQPAPELTTEQISAGELPAGHPAVNTSGAAETTPAQ